MSEIKEAENMDYEAMEGVALKRSAMHNSWLKSYPDGGQKDGMLWNQHGNLNEKHIKMIYPKQVLRNQEKAFERISSQIKKNLGLSCFRKRN